MNVPNFIRGLILVKPHGMLVASNQKILIIKSKHISTIINYNLLLLENKIGLGIIQLGPPTKINLTEFNKLTPYHRITEKERLTWWPNYTNLYAYPIIKKKFFHRALLLDYPRGPQITVNVPNIF